MGEETSNNTLHDPLTGVYNRIYFEDQLNNELQRAARYHRPLSILLLDIDKFKKVNEDFGHQIGDRVLCELSQILKQNVRTVDIVARFGDDKFIILLPETKKTQAKNLAERILRNVKKYDFFKEELNVQELTASIGVAGFPEDAGMTSEIIDKVNKALRQAKLEGGSRVILCT